MLRLFLVLLCTLCVPSINLAEETAAPVAEARGEKVDGVLHGDVEIWATPDFRQAAGKFYKGQPDGVWTFWDEAGVKTTEITYRTGTFSGTVTMWHNTASGPKYRGKLKLRGAFNDGWWQGSVLTYYPNGKVRSERSYVDGAVAAAYAYTNRGKSVSKQEAVKIAQKDQASDNAYVDAIDAFIRQFAVE